MPKDKKEKKESSFKKRTVSEAEEFLRNQYRKDILISKSSKLKLERIPTGFYKFDKSIGGGLPKGKIIEIFGDEDSGKTSFCLQMCALIQKQKKQNRVLYIDFENKLETEYAEILGVSLEDSKWTFSQPETLEEGIDVLRIMALTGEYGLIIIDSVAAMTPMEELEGSMDRKLMGAQARGMGAAMRKMIAAIKRTKTIAIFINQMRAKIGGWGVPYTTPGGAALKYYSTIRIRINSRESKEFDHGISATFTIIKNQTTIHQGLKATYELADGKGFMAEHEIFKMGIEAGIIKKKKRSYFIGKKKYSVDSLLEKLRKPEVRDKIIALYEKKVK